MDQTRPPTVLREHGCEACNTPDDHRKAENPPPPEVVQRRPQEDIGGQFHETREEEIQYLVATQGGRVVTQSHVHARVGEPNERYNDRLHAQFGRSEQVQYPVAVSVAALLRLLQPREFLREIRRQGLSIGGRDPLQYLPCPIVLVHRHQPAR